MGLYYRPREQLAPDHLALAHARLSTVRAERRNAPSCQPSISHRKHPASLSASKSIDSHTLAQRNGRSPVRITSTARRISRLGLRTHRRVERVFLFPHAAHLYW